jgi:hypothetical protein
MSDKEKAIQSGQEEKKNPGGSEAPLSAGSLKSFRQQPEMENFYRFVYENDLRLEALKIIDEILTDKNGQKNLKAPSKSERH